MEYYKDSVEASRNRLTAALEKLVSGQGIEKVLININNTLTDLINNLGTVAILLSSLIIYANREKLGNKLVGATGKIFGGYVGLGNFFSNPFSHVGNFGTNIKNNVISSIEATRLEQFDMQLGKIIGTLQVTDKSIGELGQDALISGQLIVKGLGIEGNTKLGSMSVDSRLNAVNLATQYSPEALNYALYNKLGLVGGDDQGNLNIIMKELGLSEEEAKIKLQEFKTAVEQAAIATKKNAETEDLESQKNIEAAQTEELEMASNLQQSNGGQLTKGQGTVVGGIVRSDEYGKNTKGLAVSGKAALGYGVGMIGSTIGTGVAMANSEKMGATGSMALSMGTSLAPMIGSAIGMALGGPAGGAIGSAVGGLLSIAAGAIIPYIVSQKKTTEQILEESKKATEELSDLKDDLNNRKENLTNLKDNEVRFAELIKGVDNTTGKNVSLSDSEWSEYQDILSTIIDSRDDLYASYDAEGNIVAKNADGVAKLNKIMSDSIDITERQIRQKNWEIANNKDDEGNYNIVGQISDATAKEYGNIDKTIGKLSDNFSFAIGQIYDNAGQGVTNFLGNKEIWEKYGLSNYNKEFENTDVNEAFDKLLKSGATVEDLYTVFSNNLNYDLNGKKKKKPVTFEEFANKYSPIISNYNETKENTQRAYTNGLKSALKTNFQGNEDFNALTDAEQNYLSEVVFSNIQANPYKNNDESQGTKDLEATSKAYERYKTLSEQAIKWGQLNPDKLAFLSSYDENETTFADDETRKQYLFEMFQGQDAGAVASVLKGMGYTNVSEILGQDKDGNWIWKEDSFDKLISKREKDQSVLQGLGFNNKILNQLTTEQLNALYENQLSFNGSDYTIDSEETLKKLKRELSELTLGENATLTEYFADFANQTGTSLSDIEGLKEALTNPENQDLFSLKKLKESFKELGYDVEKTDVLAEELVNHMSTLGSIDANGYTSKSLSEIESQFENIDSIVSDLTDNGKLSVENMQKLLEEFPEMIKYLGEGKDLLEAMEELQKDQAELQFASIKNTIAESEENYTEFLSTLKKEGKINDNLKDYLGMFGNSKNLVSLFNQMYQEDEDGNYTLKSRYKDMRLMDNSDFSQNSWEKIIGKYIFGIDTTTGTKEDISRKISDAVQAQADKLGLEGNTEYFINFYRHMMTNNSEFINAFQQVSDLENQLAAAKASQQLENSQWEEKVSKEISKLKDAFDAGKISIDDYIKGLQEIRRWSNLTEEQIRELDEAIEDAKFDKLSDQFDKGQISVKNYREELSKLMKNNALGSDDYNKFLEAYLGTYDTEISKLENQKSLLAGKDFQGQKNILNQENLIYEEKLAALTAAGQKNSEAYLEVLEKIKSNKEQQLEITKQELEYEKEKLETVMDAYSTLIDYRINQLQKEKDLLEERYDDEIDRLKEVNDQKQRSIDLEKYQQELENARKEKSRIYISGVGWTYQANQAKVDEAQTNLDNYLEDRKISDLENSKNREAKYYQDQIDFWNETKEKIEDVPKLASAEEAVKELIRNNVVAEGSTINTALTDIKKGITVDVDGHVVDLGIKFNTFSNNYSTVTSNLNDLNSAMDGKLGAISDWIKSYKSANDMVEALKKAFTAGVSNLNINKPQQSTVNWDKKIGEITNRLDAAKRALNDQTTILASVFTFLGTTTSSGTWKKGANVVDTSRGYAGVDGRTYWKMTNTETGKQYAILANKSNVWTKKGDPYGKAYANYGTALYGSNILIGGSFSGGIEEGMVSRTGLYKLHGTPNNPEFVLNSKQAYQLLRNISTLSIPAFESKTSTNKTINYQFYGDMNLPNVKDPSTFFSELLREADGKFNVTKLEY